MLRKLGIVFLNLMRIACTLTGLAYSLHNQYDKASYMLCLAILMASSAKELEDDR